MLGTVEEYDPASGRWSARAAMPTPRNHLVGAAVGDKIFAIGGRIGAAQITIAEDTNVVEEYDPRVVDERHRQVELAAHTTGIGRHQLLRRLRQVEPLQQAGDHPVGLAGAQPLEIGHQPQVLLAGQQLVHRGELAGHSDGRAYGLGLGRHIMAGDAYRAAVGLHQRGQHVDRRRLPRPIGAEQGEDRACGNIQIDAIEHDLVPICLSQP